MNYVLQGHEYKTAVEQIILSVLPFESLNRVYSNETKGNLLVSDIRNDNGVCTVTTSLNFNGKSFKNREIVSDDKVYLKDDVSNIIKTLKICAYKCLLNIADAKPPWGSLTGVRPAKLVRKFFDHGLNEDEILTRLINIYYVDYDKANLSIACAKRAIQCQKALESNSISLYVSIPFCPSRCSYCSFVSHSIDKAFHLIDPYVDILCNEILRSREFVSNRHIKSIYIGGGTPTVLTHHQLDRIMKCLRSLVEDRYDIEFTVEAGRPDTITKEKLEVIRQNGAQRISINPQSMNDNVLERIGRHHTSQQVIDSYTLARDVGFDYINMDVIAGLDGDDLRSFCNTIDKIVDLYPENVTVHALALKRGAHIKDYQPIRSKCNDISSMPKISREILECNGYKPYYMYRQKYTSRDGENVGFTKQGFDCSYNIYMMEELHSIISFGAGAITKIVDITSGSIKRFANPKYPYEYINRGKEVVESKYSLMSFEEM